MQVNAYLKCNDKMAHSLSPSLSATNDIQIQAANKSRRVPNLRLAGVLLAMHQVTNPKGLPTGNGKVRDNPRTWSRHLQVSLQDLQANPPKSPKSVHHISHSWDAMTSIFRYSSNQNNRCWHALYALSYSSLLWKYFAERQKGCNFRPSRCHGREKERYAEFFSAGLLQKHVRLKMVFPKNQ